MHYQALFACSMILAGCGSAASVSLREDAGTDAQVDTDAAGDNSGTEVRSDSADSDAPGGTTDAPADTGATGNDLADETSADSAGSDAADLAASDASSTDGTGAEPATDGSLSDSQDGQGQNGPVCGALVNASSAITPTQITSFSHNFQGGVVADGTYVLTSAEETIGISLTPTMFRRTFRVSNAGSVFEWVIQDIGSPPDQHFAGALSISGTSLVMTDACVPLNLVYPYDAQGTNLTLYFILGTVNGRVFHYRAL